MKFALCGLGRFGARYVETLNQIDEAEVILLHSRKADSFNKLPSRPNGLFHWTDNYDHVLNSDAEVVIIATPPQFHFDLCKKAIEAGKDVICEKPFTLSAGETLELHRLSAALGRQVRVDYIHLWQKPIAQMVDYINKHPQQKLVIESRAGGSGICRDYSSWWDWASHDLALIFSCFNQHTTSGVFFATRPLTENYNSFFSLLEFPNGRATVNICNRSSVKFREFRIDYDWDHFEFVDDFKGKPLQNMIEDTIYKKKNDQKFDNLSLAFMVNSTLEACEQNELKTKCT